MTQTNIYADQYLAANQHKIRRHSRVRRWRPTNIAEMKQFIGLTLLMGLVRKPSLSSYWSTDAIFHTPVLSKVMKRSRYQLLLRFLYFSDNSQLQGPAQQNPDRLFKIRPLVDHFLEKFQTNYGVQQDASVDKSLLLWKGRLILRQYLPLKRARFGIKIYKLCESATGYTYRYYVYVGKDDSFTLPYAPGVPVMPSDFGSTEKIVWYLMMPLLEKGHRLYVDNFYTSVRLFHTLFLHKTPACGTIQSNRKDYPQQLLQKKLTPGESSAMHSQELPAVKFTDQKRCVHAEHDS